MTTAPSTPTEQELRETGYTLDALNYPLSPEAFAELCKFNNVPAGYAVPHSWRYAPNSYVQQYWEDKAKP